MFSRSHYRSIVVAMACGIIVADVGLCMAQQKNAALSRRLDVEHSAGPGASMKAAEPIRSQLPAEVLTMLQRFETQSAEIQHVADRKIGMLRGQLIETLKPMQDAYTRQAKLDEAVAIRDCIRVLNEGGLQAQPDPGTVANCDAAVGAVRFFRVTGRMEGPVWGTDVYTTDSLLASAAVHAGAIKNQKTGIVKVTILPGQQSYQGTVRNGVASQPWQSYPTSFTVSAAAEERPIAANDKIVTIASNFTVAPGEEEEPIATNNAVVAPTLPVKKSSVKKTPDSPHIPSDLLHRKVVIYLAVGSVMGEILQVDGKYIVVERGADKSKCLVNPAAITYIAILPEK
jgi:hypothetical protein